MMVFCRTALSGLAISLSVVYARAQGRVSQPPISFFAFCEEGLHE
jgi:hypothetical protein